MRGRKQLISCGQLKQFKMIVFFFLCCFLYAAKLSHLWFRDAERGKQFHKNFPLLICFRAFGGSLDVQNPLIKSRTFTTTHYLHSFLLSTEFFINYVHAISRNNVWDLVNSQLCLNFSNVYSRTQLVITSLTNTIQIHFHLSLLIQTRVGQETKYI